MIGNVRNIASPILLPQVHLIGIAADYGAPGDRVPVWHKLGTTSDEPLFHSAVPGLCSELARLAAEAGSPVNLESAASVLLRVRPDRTGELWVDTAATLISVMMKCAMGAGQPVFEHDIADVTGVHFPAIPFEETDGILYLFRKSWRYGIYYDLHLEGSLDVNEVARRIGAIYRNLAFRHLYDAVGNANGMAALTKAGWFPFVEIASEDFGGLANSIMAGRNVAIAEEALTDKFDNARIDRIKQRWLAHVVLGSRSLVLGSALEAFKRGDYVSTVKTILTEIEGILNEAHRKAYGSGAKLGKLLTYVAKAGELKAGASDTLLFPQPFRDFLLGNTFAHGDARARIASTGSRHAVGHGAAGDEAYSRVRALQAILTMDQFVFFI